MIYTITLNPAVDKRVEIENLVYEDVNRVTHEFSKSGGKGINVSKVLKNLNVTNRAIALLGGRNGEFIEKALLKEKIELIKIESGFNTRENIEIFDKKNRKVIRINSSSKVNDEAEKTLIKLLESIGLGDIAILSGSIPNNMDDRVYYKIIKILRKQGAVLFLDSDNLAFSKGIDAKPNLIKPNFEELKRYFGESFLEEEIPNYLLKLKIETVIVSNGSKALYIKSGKIVYRVKPISIDVKSELGAGDSLLAGFTKYYSLKKSVVESISYGVAVATAYLSGELTDKNVERYIKKVEVEKLEV